MNHLSDEALEGLGCQNTRNTIETTLVNAIKQLRDQQKTLESALTHLGQRHNDLSSAHKSLIQDFATHATECEQLPKPKSNKDIALTIIGRCRAENGQPFLTCAAQDVLFNEIKAGLDDKDAQE